jgi:hypothetical protein
MREESAFKLTDLHRMQQQNIRIKSQKFMFLFHLSVQGNQLNIISLPFNPDI